jgi:hypothetical protein
MNSNGNSSLRGAIDKTLNQTPVETDKRRAEKLVDDEASRILGLVHKK